MRELIPENPDETARYVLTCKSMGYLHSKTWLWDGETKRWKSISKRVDAFNNYRFSFAPLELGECNWEIKKKVPLDYFEVDSVHYSGRKHEYIDIGNW